MESQVVEFCRSAFAHTLNGAINIFGQDLKNKQWILEPLADIIISLCVMDTCYKRYHNINDEEHKNNVADILHLSIANHYSIIVKNSKVILAYLDDMNGNSLLSDELNSWILKLGYSPNTLKYKEIIVDTLYKHEKYYLDK